MPPPARIGVLVVNYRTADLVLDLLDSLRSELDPARDRVVIVDNASGDGSADRIARAIAGSPHVQLVASDTNGGFGAGNNLAASQVDAQAYLLLNSDTRVFEGAVERLWETLQSDPTIGLVGPRIEDTEGGAQVSCFRFPTPWSELIAGSATGPITRTLSRWEVPMRAADATCDPDWTSFAAVMIRREAFDAVGGLDEGYFLYFEDVDFCREARANGYRIVHEPRARVMHFESQSTTVFSVDRERKRRPRYYYQSRSRYFRKSYGRRGLLAGNALWTLGRGVAWVREALGNKAPHTVEYELFDRWRG